MPHRRMHFASVMMQLQRGRAFEGAEMSTSGCEAKPKSSGFNGAALLRARRSIATPYWPVVSVLLQRGRAFEGAEMLWGTGKVVAGVVLQRGRAFEGAEITDTRCRLPPNRPSFNGAALLRARRFVSGHPGEVFADELQRGRAFEGAEIDSG